MLTREFMETVIKEIDTRIPVPAIKKQAIACTVCKPNRWFTRSALGFGAYIKHFTKEHLKPKVFVLWYTDPYGGCSECMSDDKYVKGIFSTRQLAEQTKKKIKSKIGYKEEDFEIEEIIMDTRI